MMNNIYVYIMDKKVLYKPFKYTGKNNKNIQFMLKMIKVILNSYTSAIVGMDNLRIN